MTGLTDLLQSERGVFALLALFMATVLAALGKIDFTSWESIVKWLAASLIFSKTVTTAVDTITAKGRAAPEPTP